MPTKRMSAGLSRDVKKIAIHVHPKLWERMETIAHKQLRTDPSKIRLTRTQVLTTLVAVACPNDERNNSEE